MQKSNVGLEQTQLGLKAAANAKIPAVPAHYTFCIPRSLVDVSE
jgi:hypothetical protein